MAIDDDFHTISEEEKQRESAFRARDKLENFTHVMYETHDALQSIKDGGKFDLLPWNVKRVLGAWWDVVKDAKIAIDNEPDIQLAFKWKRS